MTMTDPIADMLSRIRNGLNAGKSTVHVPNSRMKCSVLDVLETEGYIRGYETIEGAAHPTISVRLKYSGGKPVINELKRVSRPGLRAYSKSSDIPMVRNGLGTMIVSTSKGVMTDTQATEQKLGGELICQVF